MEIKDAIISSLAEIDEIVANNEQVKEKEVVTPKAKPQKTNTIKTKAKSNKPIQKVTKSISSARVDEIEYLKSLRERMLVLFEGLQSPQNKNIEDKLELTLNFLEYSLATIEERLKSN